MRCLECFDVPLKPWETADESLAWVLDEVVSWQTGSEHR